jgi:hypothetical protein
MKVGHPKITDLLTLLGATGAFSPPQAGFSLAFRGRLSRTGHGGAISVGSTRTMCTRLLPCSLPRTLPLGFTVCNSHCGAKQHAPSETQRISDKSLSHISGNGRSPRTAFFTFYLLILTLPPPPPPPYRGVLCLTARQRFFSIMTR